MPRVIRTRKTRKRNAGEGKLCPDEMERIPWEMANNQPARGVGLISITIHPTRASCSSSFDAMGETKRSPTQFLSEV